ncbi:MAG: antibiotic biosynthesis monooxygenase [Deltaproteobacteria bacterium]|nr:antibiotic biosynthesis monooxygenase [Deltaproteobacteria bacterium]
MSNVIVINPFEVPEGKEDEALAMWDKFADYFRKQPGYVSTKLHRAMNPDARFHLINIAEWESVEHFQAALNSEELKKLAEGSEEFPHYPGIYEVIRT